MRRAITMLVFWFYFSNVTHAISYTVNSAEDTNDVLVGDSVCMDQSGACTLRAAIKECNLQQVSGSCEINVDVTGTLVLQDHLPVITRSTVLKNYNAICGNMFAQVIQQPYLPFIIDGGGQYSALRFQNAPDSIVYGLELRNTLGALIGAQDSHRLITQCNHIHGARDSHAVSFINSNDIIIGGPMVGDGNIIHDALVDGISLSQSHNARINGNIIGLQSDGNTASSAEDCVYVSESHNVRIGVETSNVLSACTHWGIDIDHGSQDTEVAYNKIGTNVTGLIAVGNLGDGIILSGSVRTWIHHNQISGNKWSAIRINNESVDVVVENNDLGLDGNGNDTDLCNECRFSCPQQMFDSGINTTIQGNRIGTCGLGPGCCALDARDVYGIVVCVDDTSDLVRPPASIQECQDIANAADPRITALWYNPQGNCSIIRELNSVCPPPVLATPTQMPHPTPTALIPTECPSQPSDNCFKGSKIHLRTRLPRSARKNHINVRFNGSNISTADLSAWRLCVWEQKEEVSRLLVNARDTLNNRSRLLKRKISIRVCDELFSFENVQHPLSSDALFFMQIIDAQAQCWSGPLFAITDSPRGSRLVCGMQDHDSCL